MTTYVYMKTTVGFHLSDSYHVMQFWKIEWYNLTLAIKHCVNKATNSYVHSQQRQRFKYHCYTVHVILQYDGIYRSVGMYVPAWRCIVNALKIECNIHSYVHTIINIRVYTTCCCKVIQLESEKCQIQLHDQSSFHHLHILKSFLQTN